MVSAISENKVIKIPLTNEILNRIIEIEKTNIGFL